MKTPFLPVLTALLSGVLCSTHVSAQAPTPAGITTRRDLPYVEGGSERQKLDLYFPEEKTSGPLPLVIWIHGGGWAAGDKAGCPARRLTEDGYAVASINYRLSSDAIFPAQIEDCKAAVRWLRAHAKEYNFDPNHFGVWGSSAGGHLVALLGTSGDVKEFDKGGNLDVSSRVQAVCDYYGPTDLLQMDAHALPDARLKHDAAGSPEARLIGGPIQENKDKATRANPIVFVTRDDPPFLIVHGDQDPTVAHHQSELLFDALKKAGVSVHFHTIHGAGHGSGFAGKNIDDMVNAFFEKTLKAKSPAQSAPEALLTESVASAMPPERPQGQSGPSGPGGPRRGIPWEAILARDDKDHDGKVSREEFSGPKVMFDDIDRNHDGFITREEHESFQARLRGQQPATPTPAGEGNPAAAGAPKAGK